MKLKIFLVALCLGACSNRTPVQAEEKSSGIPVTWMRLADGSQGWFEEDELGVHAERCWEDVQGYRCIQLLRTDPAPNEFEVDMDDGQVTFYSRRTAKLEKDKVYIEGGYRCELPISSSVGFTAPDATESLTLSNGATIENKLYSRLDGDNRWSTKYVVDFAAKNGGAPATIVHFDCLALTFFLERANDRAFLANALKSEDVFPSG